jgi:hypothetical protein
MWDDRMRLTASLTIAAAILLGSTQVPTADPAHTHEGRSRMFNALIANGPSSEIPKQLRIYDWLIGSWKARVVDYPGDGQRRENIGEWHFAWVLEGRAIQDVWISPPRNLRSSNTPKSGNRYGTSVRSFHPDDQKWHVTWINPVSGAINLLVARSEGEGIVQEGLDDEGNMMRWVFTDIKEDSARWYGERSKDGGKTWVLEAEFFLERN